MLTNAVSPSSKEFLDAAITVNDHAQTNLERDAHKLPAETVREIQAMLDAERFELEMNRNITTAFPKK